MLDIKLFRENIDLIKDSEKKRFRDTDNVDKVVDLDIKWRKNLADLSELRRERNNITKDISTIYKDLKKLKKKEDKDKALENVESLKAESKEKGKLIELLEPKVKELLSEREKFRYKVGNILDPSVPIAEDDKGDKVIRKVGKRKKFTFSPKNHVELIEIVDGAVLKKASEIAGHRFYYLKHEIVKLNLALLNFALDNMTKNEYTPLWTPFFTKYEVMKEAAELADFEETLYRIEGEDLFLIATSEQTLAALHRNDVISEKLLPLKYAGLSTCFRKEAGSHGKDTLGIFRVHQFEKAEQFIFCHPDDSSKMHKELITNTESLFKQLKIPYRVVNIASGELNDNASIKYDLEGWFPASDAYRELASCSNCLDYQARKLNVRFGTLGDPDTYKVAHTLNSTGIATERTICCILENYQNEDGSISIPDVLIPYMGGIIKIQPKGKNNRS